MKTILSVFTTLTEESDLSAYHDGRNVFYIGEFDGEMEQNILIPLGSAIRAQSELRDGRIDLYVNSYGGNAHLLMHVIEMIEMAKRNDVVVRTMVTGAAYSAGSMVAVAGTPGERYISKEAMHLVHYGNSGGDGDETPLQAQRRHDANQVMFRQVIKHYQKHCDIPDLEDNILDDNWYITATQAKRWNMADKYLDRFKMKW